MCKRHARRMVPPALASEGAYEGETARLESGELDRMWDGRSRAERRGACRGGFPWWALWLLWPLFFVLKPLAMAARGAMASVAGPVALADLPAALLAVALIVAGLLLVLRGERSA